MEDDDPAEVTRKLEQTTRLASSITDETTVERFRAFASQLRQKLRRLLRRDKQHEAIRARAYLLWERAGRPTGRDLEFWLEAERELREQENKSARDDRRSS